MRRVPRWPKPSHLQTLRPLHVAPNHEKPNPQHFHAASFPNRKSPHHLMRPTDVGRLHNNGPTPLAHTYQNCTNTSKPANKSACTSSVLLPLQMPKRQHFPATGKSHRRTRPQRRAHGAMGPGNSGKKTDGSHAIKPTCRACASLPAQCRCT